MGWRINGGLLMAAVLFLATNLAAQQNLPSVHELAQRVDRHYDQLQSLKAGFSESYAGLGMTKTESGTLFLRKPGRMMWQLQLAAGKDLSPRRQIRVVLRAGRRAGAAHPGE